MQDTALNPHILALLHFARQQELVFVAGLSEAERNAIGTPDSWTAKDFLANILCWKELQTQKLAAAQRGEVPPIWKDMDVVHQINSQAFARYQHTPFQEVMEIAERAFNALIAQVERMSEEEINDPLYYAWQEGFPLRSELLSNGFGFACNQLMNCALQQGKDHFAFALQDIMVEKVRQSALPSEGVAGYIYNAACFYATHARPEQAIQVLPEAFRLRPILFEWAKNDSDLDSLRSLPAFQAIFADPVLLALLPVNDLISPQDLDSSLNGDTRPLIIDVRKSSEYAEGHVADAINIPLGMLESSLAQIDPERRVVTYCNMHHRGGSRGEQAAILLRAHGYQVQALDGGYPAWKELGFATHPVLA